MPSMYEIPSTHPIICRRCFREVAADGVRFKCMQCLHEKRDHVFTPRGKVFDGSNLILHQLGRCARHGSLSSMRVCPSCETDLPNFSGLLPSRVIAVAGAPGSGKTLYLIALLNHLMQSAADALPGLVPLFEDDASRSWYEDHYWQLVVKGMLPAATRRADPPPINVRLLGPGIAADAGKSKKPKAGNGQARTRFLSMYDPAGEMFKSIENARFVQYLGGAAGIVLLLDAQRVRAGESSLPGTSDATAPERVIDVLVRSIRDERGLGNEDPIPIPLAITLSKCDLSLYADLPMLHPGSDGGKSAADKWAHMGAVSHHCRKLFTQWGHDNFLNKVDQNFKNFAFFACSAMELEGRKAKLNPVGVADPILWMD